MNTISLSFVADFIAPLAAAITDRDDLEKLLAQIGFDIALDDDQAQAVQTVIGLSESLTNLIGEAEALIALDEVTATDLAPALADALDLLLSIRNLAQIPPGDIAQLPGDLSDANQWRAALRRLPEVLLLEWLAVSVKPVYAPLKALGIVTETLLPRHVNVYERVLHWDRLGTLFDDPASLIVDTYGWGGTLDDVLLLRNIGDVLQAYGLKSRLRAMSAQMQGSLQPDATGTPYQLIVASPKLPPIGGGPPAFADLVLAGRQAGAGLPLDGLAATISASHTVTAEIPLGDGGFVATTSLGGTLDGLAGLALHPGGPELFGTAPSITATFGIGWDGAEPIILMGKAGGSRLELTKFGLSASLTTAPAKAEGRVDIGGETRDGLRAVITAGDGDAFLQSLLGDQAFEVNSGFGITADSDGGIRFEGGAGFQIERQIGLNAGPFRLDSLRLAMSAGGTGADAVVAITGGADLNVISFVVDDIGIKASLLPTPEGEDGMFGSMDLKVGFKPPTGLGLAIEAAGVISGGGYLSIEPDIGRYAGVGSIKFVKIGLTAVGIIETQMPDGSDGWSLYISVVVTFPGGLPIFPSVFLSGIGGLLGLNRTVDEDALFDRLLDGALDSIMFPADPIANAPQIIEDTAVIFPAAQGQFLFGALFQLKWSEFVVGNLGVVVELPSPFRLITLGQMKMGLPQVEPPPDVPKLVSINLDVAGVFDFTEAKVEMVAVLRDSFIGPDPALVPDGPRIQISGGMALKATFAGRPEMILSIGGFHPDYTPPEGFRTPDRVRASLPVGSIANVSLSGYFAIAPGAIMAGGRLDIYARLAGFTAEGWLGFDAIIFTDPFGFDFRTEFGVAISKGRATILSIDVSARVTGPQPIEVWADATFELLGFDKTIDLHLTTGGGRADRPARVSVAPLVADALAKPDALKSGETTVPVTLAEGSTALDPAAALEVSQSVVPLDTEIEIYQGAPIEGAKQFEISELSFDGQALAPDKQSQIEGWFPYNEYFDLTEDEKLARPSFEEMRSGTRIQDTDTAYAGGVTIAEGYDERIVDRAFNYSKRKKRAAKETSAAKTLGRLRRTSVPKVKTVGGLSVGNKLKLVS